MVAVCCGRSRSFRSIVSMVPVMISRSGPTNVHAALPVPLIRMSTCGLYREEGLSRVRDRYRWFAALRAGAACACRQGAPKDEACKLIYLPLRAESCAVGETRVMLKCSVQRRFSGRGSRFIIL